MTGKAGLLMLGTAIALLLPGCSRWRPPPPASPIQQAPPGWHSTHQQGRINASWQPWTLSPQLRNLLTEALASNPGLRQQAARVDEAVHQAGSISADALPQLQLSLSGGRQSDGGEPRNRIQGQLRLQWQLDPWRELSARDRAAALQALQALADYRQARLELLADTGRAWLELLESQQQQALLQRRLENLGRQLEIVESGYRSGLNDSLDVYLARADLASSRARLAARDSQLAAASRQLEQLLGRYPAAALRAAGELDQPLTPLPAGLPSELLVRRPDLQAGQYALAAANQQLAAAYKARFPSLELTAAWGSSSSRLAELVRGDSLIWSAFVNATAPLLDGERLLRQQQRQQANAQALAAALQATVLRAFAEVEQALEAEAQLDRQQQLIDQAADNAGAAYRRAFEQYRAGLADYITVLESERRNFDARSERLTIRKQRLQTRIDLLLALGGEPGWSGEPQATPMEIRPIEFHYP